LFDKTQQDNVIQDFIWFLFFFRDEVVIIFYCLRAPRKWYMWIFARTPLTQTEKLQSIDVCILA